MAEDRYLLLGVTLTAVGSLVVFVSTMIRTSVVFGSMGLAIAIIGLTSMSLPQTEGRSDAALALLQGSTYGIEPMLSEIISRRDQQDKSRIPNGNGQSWENLGEEGVRHAPPAIYLPPPPYEGWNSAVYIPIEDHTRASMEDMRYAPTEVLPAQRNQRGVRVFTAGSYLGQLPELKKEGAPIEEMLKLVLVHSARLCSSVRAVEVRGSIVVEIIDFEFGLESEAYRTLLGTLPVSIAASIVAAAKGYPVEITNEDVSAERIVARLTFVGGEGG